MIKEEISGMEVKAPKSKLNNAISKTIHANFVLPFLLLFYLGHKAHQLHQLLMAKREIIPE